MVRSLGGMFELLLGHSIGVFEESLKIRPRRVTSGYRE